MNKQDRRTCINVIMLAVSFLSGALARQLRHNVRTTSTSLVPLHMHRRCLAFQINFCGGMKASTSAYRGVVMSLFDGDSDAWSESPSSSLPYSTTSSNAAPTTTADSKSLSSMSSLPFRAPRTSFDDSLPVSLTSDGRGIDGALEWSKLGLLTDLVDAVVGNVADRKGLGLIDGPTPVQKMVIPEILLGCKDRMAFAENVKSNSGDTYSSSSTLGDKDAIPPVRSIAFAAATGSGKTLAYLLPIIQSLRAQELMAIGSLENKAQTAEKLASLRRPRRPRALILAPTRELARQILSVLKSVGHICKISCDILVGGDDYGTQRKKVADRPIDILVATPGRLVKHRDAGDVFLGSVRHVVVDEMDTMLEQGFQNDLGKLLHPMLYRKKVVEIDEYKNGKLQLVEGSPQVILTTATLTPAIRRSLDKPELPFEPKKMYGKQSVKDEDDSTPNLVNIALPRDIRILTAPGLHRVVPRLKQVFVNVGSVDKLSLLVDVVAGGERQKREKQRRGGPLPLTLVFCNTVASCRAAEHALAESGVSSLCYHGELNSADREENLQKFRKVGEDGDSDGASVLVCTDIASRGLDVPEVDHVVMFDFPLNPIDYLHRAGRTARGLGSRSSKNASDIKRGEGKVTALVAKRDQVLAKAIETAVQRGESLEGLSSRKSDYVHGAKLGARSPGRGGGSGSGGGRGRGRGTSSNGRDGRGRGRGGEGRESNSRRSR